MNIKLINVQGYTVGNWTVDKIEPFGHWLRLINARPGTHSSPNSGLNSEYEKTDQAFYRDLIIEGPVNGSRIEVRR